MWRGSHLWCAFPLPSPRLAPALFCRGYQLTYREFQGGHNVPGWIASEGGDWLLGSIVDMRQWER